RVRTSARRPRRWRASASTITPRCGSTSACGTCSAGGRRPDVHARGLDRHPLPRRGARPGPGAGCGAGAGACPRRRGRGARFGLARRDAGAARPLPGACRPSRALHLRRAAVLARPFDEEIAIAEDHLWARGVAERIVYVPEAVVAHSHPMRLAVWRARFYAHGLAAEYARRRRGVELPWGGPRDGAARR